MQSTDPPGESATLDDVRDAIIGLPEADAMKIDMAASSFAWGSEFEPQDLINEAISRTLSGVENEDGRHWLKNTPFVAFIIMTMKSIANGSRSSEHRRKTINLEAITLPGSTVEEVLGALSCHGPDPMSQSIDEEEDESEARMAEEAIAALEEYFAEDEGVFFIILGLKEEKSAKDIQEISGMNQKEYEAARRRFRRGVADLFPEKRPV